MESGLICPGSVGIHQMPLTAVTESMNFEFDSIGSARLRKGSTSLGTGLAASNVLGLYEFNDDPGTYHRLVCVNGTVLYYLSGTTWTSKRTGLTASKKARFTTFLNYLWMVNGSNDTAIWDGQTGNSFVTTGNASGAPVGKFIEVFRARVWITGNATYPDRIYFSSLPSAVATPVITWNTSATTGDWIDISPSDGENITALKRMQNSFWYSRIITSIGFMLMTTLKPMPRSAWELIARRVWWKPRQGFTSITRRDFINIMMAP